MKHEIFDLGTTTKAPLMRDVYLPALDLTIADDCQKATIAALLAPGRRRASFVTANSCNAMQQHKPYAKALRTTDILLPDGVGIALAARMNGHTLATELNAMDLIPALLRQAAMIGKSVYLFGGAAGAADTAAYNITQEIPYLRIVGKCDGCDVKMDEDATVRHMNASGADIVIVALEVPKQELWLERNFSRLNAGLLIGVGGALEYLAGNVVRAPLVVRQARSERSWDLVARSVSFDERFLAGNCAFIGRTALCALKRVPQEAAMRRAFDVCVASVALAVLSPVMGLSALAIKTESNGPVLSKHKRVGKDGETFNIYTFRAIVADTKDLRSAKLLGGRKSETDLVGKKGPVVTGLGRFLRRFSIEKAPLLLNLLRGEMAVVGPRAALQCEIDAFPTGAQERLSVKPGLTGVWFVSGREDTGFEKMIEMDLAYAASRTILLDLILLFMTVQTAVIGRGR